MKNDFVVGVDGCRAGWIAALLSPARSDVSFSVHANFREVLRAHADARSIAVDIPIGLSECFTPRCCDREARALLGPRRSSVFPAPDRRLLAFDSYAKANSFARRQCGKGISQQCFHIFTKIAEVDALLTPALQAGVFEVHPEVCFRAAAGRSPLQHPKRTAEGYDERRRILSREFAGAQIGPRSEIVKSTCGMKAREVQPDDILDAMIAAWTALRHSRNQHERLPAAPEYDARGLRMEIVF